ncbi:MAG TPA: hypothetical protein VE177_01100 [Candidatus Binatus sp.]|nr:hypothetical protein [Candidatus Binatus sp.]
MSRRYAVISVYDKTGLNLLVEAFEKAKIEIMGSGGTAETIRKMGRKVVEVSEYTGFPEMPTGLVKTLHPKIHAGILGDWNIPEQRTYLEKQEIQPLDFVVVNLYPFQEVVKSGPYDIQKAVDNIDIGGVALIRAAAKGALLNHRVVPVTSPKYYPMVAKELSLNERIGDKLRRELVNEAFRVTSTYDTAIHDYLTSRRNLSGMS